MKWFSLIANIICPQWSKRLGAPKNIVVEGGNHLGQKQKWLQRYLTNRLNPCTWWWCRWTCSRCCCWCWNLLSTYPDVSSGIFSPQYFFFREINFTKKNSISFIYNNQLATSIWFFIIHSFIHLINTNNKTKQMYVNIYTRLKSNILPCFLALVEATTERVAPQGSLHIICPIYRSWLCRETLLYNITCFDD